MPQNILTGNARTWRADPADCVVLGHTDFDNAVTESSTDDVFRRQVDVGLQLGQRARIGGRNQRRRLLALHNITIGIATAAPNDASPTKVISGDR